MPACGTQARAELDDVAPVRGAVYAFLSAGFSRPPDAAQIETWRDDRFATDCTELLGEEGAALLRQFAGRNSPIEALVREAALAFTALFQVPGGQSVAPYESVFRHEQTEAGRPAGLLMGRPVVEVQRWYRLAALDIAPGFRDLPDHISLESSFLARLCQLEEDFRAAGDRQKERRAREMERDFLAAHLVCWAGSLADAVRARTQHPWFRGLAAVLGAFPAGDLAELEQALGPALPWKASDPGLVAGA